MDTFDDLRELRRYTSSEVVELLAIKPTWLKRWVTARAVPFQLSGEQRGVWFTYADIREIGRLLPSLMTGRQANSRAESGDASSGADGGAEPAVIGGPVIGDDEFAAFLELRSMRTR